MDKTSHNRRDEVMKIKYEVGDCSLRKILVAQSEKGICAILFGDDSSTSVLELQRAFKFSKICEQELIPRTVVSEVVKFVELNDSDFPFPLDVRGTDFQLRVWHLLRSIPPGKTLSYSEVAKLIGQPKAVRAVASACAANILGVVIPCHRVVHSNSRMAAYGWGLWRKNWLLSKEKRSARKNICMQV